MKSARQLAILDIISHDIIETQEELADCLRARSISVTQATVSRDIKELRLVKVMTPSGVYKYAAPDRADVAVSDRLRRMLAESMLSAVSAGNMVVVKTLPGSASVACEAIDSMALPESLGTIAGENTIFMVCTAPEDAIRVVEQLRMLMK